ncbi:MAG: M55 family metallopeptidase, partial [Pseudomonadota bacterium]
NGTPASETVLSAAIAGHFGAPILMATGDADYVAHVRDVLGGIETVVTKTAYGRVAAQTATPTQSRAWISEAVPKALARAGEQSPFILEPPVILEADFQRHMAPELLSYLPSVERVASKTIRFKGRDITDISKFLAVVAHYSYAL